MPLNRISKLAAVVSLLGLLAPILHAQTYTIKGPNDLKQVPAQLKTAPEVGTHTIEFVYYKDPGQLKLDKPSANVQVLQLQRSSSDSEAVIKVDSTFIDIGNMTTGALVLRGLAFKMMNPKAVLIAGSDNARPNHDLLIDSCIVFGDSVEGPFLSWLGNAGSRIEIRNSWFVYRGGKIDLAKMLLNGETIVFTNNLINFPGSIESQAITKVFEFRSNTLNRTQLALNGKLTGGKFPTFNFNRNLFAHRNPYSVFGGDLYYVASIGSFDMTNSYVSYNRMYSTWKGFDFQNPTKFGLGEANVIDTLQDGKTVTELWDWYTDVKDAVTGLLSGTEKRLRYNSMPGATSFSASSEKGDLVATYQAAQYPRMVAYSVPSATVLPDSAFRIRYPIDGALHFGPVQIEKLTLAAKAIYGKPVLLAQDSTGKFRPQPGTSQVGENTSVFANALPTARYFVLADSGNTPRGFNITPSGMSLDASERFSIGKVDTSGQTLSSSRPLTAWPRNVRPLNATFGFTTNAAIASTVNFGAPSGFAPWHPGKDSVFWMQLPSALLPVTRDSGRYLATAAFNSRTTPEFMAYLVEKLSMPSGDTSFTLVDGTLRSFSAKGYQIYIDSNAAYDVAQYGQGTKGYRVNWIGRDPNDSLFLNLKGHPLSQVFVKTTAGTSPLPEYLADANQVYKIKITMADSGKTFFAAVQFNVLPNVPFSAKLPDSVQVDGFTSTTGGKLAFATEPKDFVLTVGPTDSAEFWNTRFLGGRKNVSYHLNPTGKFALTFGIGTYQAKENLEAWFLDESGWKRLERDSLALLGSRIRLGGVPAGALRVVVIERFQAPEIYVAPKDSIAGDSLLVYLKPYGAVNPILGFCIETKAVDPSGAITKTDCAEKKVTETIRVQILPNQSYSWRIIYFMGTENDKVPFERAYRILAGTGWNAKGPLSQRALLPSGQWRLAGIPVAGALGKFFRRKGGLDSTKYKDSTIVLQLKNNGTTGAAFDTAKGWKDTAATPGKAFLFADSRETVITLDSVDATRTAKPETLSLSQGWHLIGNPYPITLPLNRIRSNPPHPLVFKTLRRIPTAPLDRRYTWDSLAVPMIPFEGYAYFAPAAEQLIFDPGDTITATAASIKPKLKANAVSGYRVQVALQGAFGASSMALTNEAGETPVGFLPTPGAGVELRVGDRGGYSIKPVNDFRSVDEPVTIRSYRAGTFVFTFGEEGAGKGLTFALIDETSGAIYDRASARELPVTAGANQYRLVAGDPAFVAERSRAFLAGAPAEIGLSQNFPNPFRGRTRIALEWPASKAPDRKARLEVIDMQGRRVASLAIEGIKVGRQVLDLDASAWKPGLYVYRLTVSAGGRVSRLQKRMLVSP